MKAFIKKVAEMRTLQTQYFRTRERQTLQNAKKAESEVDRMIREYEEKQKNEPTLFP